VDYLMVPVPEELASRVLSYVNWKRHPRLLEKMPEDADDAPHSGPEALAPLGDTGEPIVRAFARLDDSGRTLAGGIAAAALDREELTIPEAARRTGIATREAVGATLELVNFVSSEGGPPPIAAVISEAEGSREADFSWGARVVVMQEPVAAAWADAAGAYGSA
jgi:hypothetical protein